MLSTVRSPLASQNAVSSLTMRRYFRPVSASRREEQLTGVGHPLRFPAFYRVVFAVQNAPARTFPATRIKTLPNAPVSYLPIAPDRAITLLVSAPLGTMWAVFSVASK